MNILLIGAGAVGSFYCGKLSAGNDDINITALCRSNYEVVKQNGVEIASPYGDFTFKPDNVIKSIDEYKLSPDYIIIATKVLPDFNMVSLIKDVVQKKTSIVLIQNGMDVEVPYHEAFPENDIITCLAYICTYRSDPGKVVHQSHGFLEIGKFPSGTSENIEQLSNYFNNAGIKCTANEEVDFIRWKKLLWNIPYNALSVIGGELTTKDMTRIEEINSLVVKMMKEIILVARKDGYQLEDSLIERFIHFTGDMPEYSTSMLIDYQNKRPMEVEAIVGNTLRMAKNLNMETPLLETVYTLLKSTNIKNIE